ncbi:MAG: polysaccharide biosynthesis tyrosine autokinase, partial [Thermoguttaceae bacterium]|nr:polysaccharide biosynthesis tyrosine autokinase [Thermoguttaceae bacterium]
MTPAQSEPVSNVPAQHIVTEMEDNKEVGFLDLLLITKRHWFLILMVFLIILGLVFFKFITTTSMYQSRAILYISSQNAQALVTSNEFTQNNMDEKFLNTMVALLRNEDVLNSTWQAIFEDPDKRVDIDDEYFDKGAEAWTHFVLMHLSVKLGGEGDIKKANVFQVAFTCQSPREAYVVLRELISQFQSYFRRQYEKTTDIIGETIKQGRDELDREIQQATDELSSFIRNSGIHFIGNLANNPLLTRLQRLESTRVHIEVQQIKYRNRLDIINSLIDGREVSELSDAEIVTILSAGEETASGSGMEQHLNTLTLLVQGGQMENSLNRKLLKLDIEQAADMMMQIAKLREQNVGDENPSILALRKAHEDLVKYRQEKTGIEESGGTINKIGIFSYQTFLLAYVDILNNRIEALDKQKEEIQKYIAAQEDQVRAISAYCQKVESMRFSIDSQREFYLQLDRKLDNVVLTRNYGGYQVEVVSPPREEFKPVSPNLLKYILTGVLLGLAGGFSLALLSDVTDTTFRSPEDIINALNTPIIAQLPAFRISKKTLSKISSGNEPGVPNSSFVAYHFPNSPQNEIYRSIRTRIFFNPSGNNPQVLMCSSPLSGDGKTTFSATLAILLANTGKKVLLVDGDIRKPDVHKKFNLENGLGFADVLAGISTLDDVMVKTKVDNLTLITAGLHRKKPSAILTSARLDAAINEMREKFDFVIFDSSPVLLVSDSCNIAPKADGVLYVFRVRRRGQVQAEQGIGMLADVGAKIMGTVVNC